MEYDFRFEDAGSFSLCQPLSDEACSHLQENVAAEAMFWGDALLVEHRYAPTLKQRLADEGWRVA